MRRTWPTLLLLLLGGCGYLLPRAASLPPSELPHGDYRLDPEHATVLFKVDHLGFSRLIGRFDRFDATLDFDPAAPQQATLVVVIDVATHRPEPTRLRGAVARRRLARCWAVS